MARLLVVDDEAAIRTLASMILKSAGHEVLAASNGVEAVALYRSSPDLIDVIITDLKMPVMDGFQAVRLIRETQAMAKIICMSGYVEPERCPADVLFLQKPFTPKELCACVDELLRNTK